MMPNGRPFNTTTGEKEKESHVFKRDAERLETKLDISAGYGDGIFFSASFLWLSNYTWI